MICSFLWNKFSFRFFRRNRAEPDIQNSEAFHCQLLKLFESYENSRSKWLVLNKLDGPDDYIKSHDLISFIWIHRNRIWKLQLFGSCPLCPVWLFSAYGLSLYTALAKALSLDSCRSWLQKKCHHRKFANNVQEPAKFASFSATAFFAIRLYFASNRGLQLSCE